MTDSWVKVVQWSWESTKYAQGAACTRWSGTWVSCPVSCYRRQTDGSKKRVISPLATDVFKTYSHVHYAIITNCDQFMTTNNVKTFAKSENVSTFKLPGYLCRGKYPGVYFWGNTLRTGLVRILSKFRVILQIWEAKLVNTKVNTQKVFSWRFLHYPCWDKKTSYSP